ncbi:hypothetical protein ACTHQ2_23660 [Bacillus subtilis]|uniref:hypothetical protein n=1 Tax=Bacillus subtilis TaxID=1423 RepID=UPI003F7B4749
MEEFDEYGNRIHLTAQNAQDTIGLAVEHLIHKTQLDARVRAFEENTAFWKGKVEKIHEFGGPPRVQLSKILTLFKIEVKDEDNQELIPIKEIDS